jgi:hypothetical protein
MNSRRFFAIRLLVVALGAFGGIECSNSGSAGTAGAPACAFDGGLSIPSSVPASGSFMGPGLSGEVCAGGAFADLLLTRASDSSPSQFLVTIDDDASGSPADFNLMSPADATVGFEIQIGVSAAAPGTYASTKTCGNESFCVYFPVPASVNCGNATAPTSCPPGCSLVGAVSAPTCMPVAPENCYVAQAASDCLGDTVTPEGSWTLTLTSVAPYDGGDGGPGTHYVVHGSFTTSMVGQGAGLGTMDLSLSF